MAKSQLVKFSEEWEKAKEEARRELDARIQSGEIEIPAPAPRFPLIGE